MDLWAEFFVGKSSRIVFFLLLAFSLVCTQIPLFNYLGFEFSVLTALVAGFVSGLWVIAYVDGKPAKRMAGKRRKHPTLASHESSAPNIPDCWEAWRLSTMFSLLLLTLPFVVLSANALFVKNCSLAGGALLFFLIAVPGVLFSNAIALLVAFSVRRWTRTVFILCFLAVLFQSAYVTFSGVRIFAFNPILGYFPGITYDESLEITNRLLLYRAATVAAIMLLVLLAVGFSRSERSGLRSWRGFLQLSGLERATAAAMFLVVVLFFIFSDHLGLSASENSVKAALGGVRETEHFVIVYPKQKVDQKQADELALLHEFLYSELTNILRVQPLKKITTFFYGSPEEKERLIGAGRTNIAKPWLWQIHLNLSDVNGSLRHELVHVLAAEFGFPLLRVGLNSGLIEGLATAIERVSYDEPIHRAAALVYATGANPDIHSLFSISGFFKAHPGVSYTLAGSFCRFLIDRYGLRRFKSLYRTGDFSSLYDRDLSVLLSEWRRFLNRYRFDEGEKEKGAYLFRRPTIFTKECARVIAALNDETRAHLQRKNYTAALGSASRSLGLSTNIDALTQRVNALFRLGRYEEAIERGQEALADSSIAHSLLPLKLVMGDAKWASRRTQEAKEMYEELRATHLSLGWDEACQIRIEALNDPELAEELKSYFRSDLEDSLRVELLKAISEAHPTSPLPKFLLGRELAGKEKFDEALDPLLGINRMPSDVLEYVRHRRIGQIYFRLHEFQKAKIYFWQALNFAEREERSYDIEQWLRRCDWMEERNMKQ